MSTPSGSEAQAGYRFATGLTALGQSIWQGAVNKFIRFISMSGTHSKRTVTPVQNMDPANQELSGSTTQAALSPKFTLNPDVNSIAPLLVHHCGSDPVITTPAGGTTSRQWVIAPFKRGDTAPAAHIDSISIEAYDGQTTVLDEGVRLQDVGIKIDQGKFVVVDLGFLACSDTFTSDATQVTLAGAYSGKPIIKGQWGASTATPIKVKATAAASGGNNGTVKVTTGSYAGSTTMTIVFGTWQRIVLDDGSRAGINRDDDLWILFPATSPATTLTVNDEWSFASTRTPASPSYSSREALRAGGLEITFGGVVYYVRSADVKLTRPRKANFVAGLLSAKDIQGNGKWRATITLDRDREDTVFLMALIRSNAVAVAVKMYGLPIEGAIDELWQIDFPNVKVADDQRDVATENALPEKIELVAHRAGSTDIFTHTLVNTLTAL